MTAAAANATRAPATPRTATEQQLITAQDLFIRRWGEMGQTWGINRTMAEIHALLYITGAAAVHGRRDGAAEHQPGQREHEPAGAVRLGHHPPAAQARRAAGVLRVRSADVWEMFSIIAAERKRREMDPVLETIRQCQQMLDESTLGKAGAKRRKRSSSRASGWRAWKSSWR